MRARSTRLIWPLSSDTTTTMASVCSVMPRAALWRVPNRSSGIVVSAEGSSAPAARISVAPDDDRAVVKRRLGREERDQQVRGYVGVEHDAGLGDLLQAGLALDHDQGPVALVRQTFRGTGHLGRDMDDRGLLRRRDQPAKRAQTADPVERPPQLRLEDDDQREETDIRPGLEDDREQPQVERQGGAVDKDEQGTRR